MTVTYKEKHEKTRKNTKIIKLKDCFSHFSCLVTGGHPVFQMPYDRSNRLH